MVTQCGLFHFGPRCWKRRAICATMSSSSSLPLFWTWDLLPSDKLFIVLTLTNTRARIAARCRIPTDKLVGILLRTRLICFEFLFSSSTQCLACMKKVWCFLRLFHSIPPSDIFPKMNRFRSRIPSMAHRPRQKYFDFILLPILPKLHKKHFGNASSWFCFCFPGTSTQIKQCTKGCCEFVKCPETCSVCKFILTLSLNAGRMFVQRVPDSYGVPGFSLFGSGFRFLLEKRQISANSQM